MCTGSLKLYFQPVRCTSASSPSRYKSLGLWRLLIIKTTNEVGPIMGMMLYWVV